MTGQRPPVVCICGSTRFRAEMAEVNRRLTMDGAIVVAPGVFGHSGDTMTDADKERLDSLHRHKIDMCDRVVVVAPGGYVGESTRAEIQYASATGKPVDFVDEQRAMDCGASIHDADTDIRWYCAAPVGHDGDHHVTVGIMRYRQWSRTDPAAA